METLTDIFGRIANIQKDAAILMDKIKAIERQLKKLQPRKSYVSPYAKFDKIRRKRK